MPQGTLANLANSAFVRTPPAFAARIVRCLLSFPEGKTTNVLDPTAGEGDLLVPCLDIPYVRLYGVEISAERTAVARTRLPNAELVNCAFEGVIPISILCGKIQVRNICLYTMWKGMNVKHGTSNHPS